MATPEHFIVTRPAHQAEPLVSLVKNNGLTVSAIALLSISPAVPEIPDELFIQALQDSNSLWLFVSPNAVFYARQHMSSDQWQQLLQHQLFAVGQSTAADLRQAGASNVIVPDQANSEGLLQLAELQQVAGQTVILVNGQGGRPLLQQTLQARQAKVTNYTVYRRQPIDCSTFHKELYDKLSEHRLWKDKTTALSPNIAWIISSESALEALSNCLDHPVSVIVTSDRLAKVALKYQHNIIGQSASAHNDDIVRCLAHLNQDTVND